MKNVLALAAAATLMSSAAFAAPLVGNTSDDAIILAQVDEQPLDKSQAGEMADTVGDDENMSPEDSSMMPESSEAGEDIEAKPLEKNEASDLEEAIEEREEGGMMSDTESDEAVDEQAVDPSQETPSDTN